MKTIFATAIAVLFTTAAHARLGETEGQSQVRYGQPREDLRLPDDKPLVLGAPERCYEYEGFRVRAAFAGGTCLAIEYAKIPENGQPKPLIPAEINAILEAEKNKWRWKEEQIKAPPGVADLAKGIQGALKYKKWERSDGAIAEMHLGLLLKIKARDAEAWEKRLAREAAKAPQKPAENKPAPNVPKF